MKLDPGREMTQQGHIFPSHDGETSIHYIGSVEKNTPAKLYTYMHMIHFGVVLHQ